MPGGPLHGCQDRQAELMGGWKRKTKTKKDKKKNTPPKRSWLRKASVHPETWPHRARTRQSCCPWRVCPLRTKPTRCDRAGVPAGVPTTGSRKKTRKRTMQQGPHTHAYYHSHTRPMSVPTAGCRSGETLNRTTQQGPGDKKKKNHTHSHIHTYTRTRKRQSQDEPGEAEAPRTACTAMLAADNETRRRLPPTSEQCRVAGDGASVVPKLAQQALHRRIDVAPRGAQRVDTHLGVQKAHIP